MKGAVVALALASVVHGTATDSQSSNPNIIVLELNEMGHAHDMFDLSTYKSLVSESIRFPSHYSGYQSGASKSQLMTGIHAFHAGYGQIGEDFDFGHAMIGGVPLKHSLISEHLKTTDDYKTYFIGTWGLGYSLNEQLPNNRGFDYFYGSYTGENDVKTKKSSYTPNEYVDPAVIINDENEYFDLWEDTQAANMKEAQIMDSISQYADKAARVINRHDSSSPMYLHISFQGPKQYSDSDSFKFQNDVISKCNHFEENLQFVCQYSKHLDDKIGRIISMLKKAQMWENSVVLILADNGADLSLGSCNYPLRGGKNSYFQGNLNSFAMVSGGIIPESRRGISLSGLVSNVDWAPTLLSFANMISHDTLSVASFDGLNHYNYIMNDADEDSLGSRDHIMFHLSPWIHDNFNVYIDGASSVERLWGWDESSARHLTLNEIGMVFYDDNGVLWKYFVTDDYYDHENKDGLLTKTSNNVNYNWCMMTGEGKDVDVSYTEIDFSDNVGVLSGLYQLTSDVSEQNNLLTTIPYDDFMTLKNIVKEKADNYLNSELNTHAWTLYNSVAFGKNCFYTKRNTLSFGKTYESDYWVPFFDSIEDYKNILHTECGISILHGLYELYTSDLQDTETIQADIGTSSSTYQMHEESRVDAAQQLQQNSPAKTQVSHDSVDEWVSAFMFDTVNKYTTATMTDDENVYSSCEGLSDGFYYVQIDFDSSMPVVKVECNNEYMIINYALDNNWESYFLSFFQSHAKVASPFKTDTADWESWFLPDGGNTDYDYLVSPMCNSCNEESLYQTSGTSTTYWENAVNSYCATNARGQPAGDAKWQSYTCRESVYSHGTSKTDITKNNLLYDTFVDDWIVTDLNGIDKDILLTPLAGGRSGHLGTCLTLKQASDNDHFTTIPECEMSDVGNGNVPTIGIKGEYCVCAKKSASTEAQMRKITAAEISGLNTMATQVKHQKLSENTENANIEKEIYQLYQSDFVDGTYRIQEPGIYMIMEDIVFDYNSPDYENDVDYSANSVYSDDGDIYWYPKVSQKDQYPGAYEFHDPYLLGFFAGITIESDDVTIDLNGKKLSMDERYFYQQPWWSHIEIGSQAFVPGEGPSHFGATPTYVKNVEIKNGVLGLTSHHCVHGTAPEASLLTNVIIKDVVCKDFITHGIQLNGFNGLTIDNVEIGPNANMQYLTVDYSQMRTLLPRFEYFADFYNSDEYTYRFGGKPSADYISENNLEEKVSLSSDKDYTLREILDEMILQMDMAFDYVTKRKTEDELNEEYGVKWLQAKRVFVSDDQSGIPYGGVIYGLYLNYPSSGISGFYRNSDKSYDVSVNNLYVHDITHSSREEAYLLKSMRSVFALPIVARLWMGEDAVTGFSTIRPSEDVHYYGTIVYDWLIAYFSILKDDVNNVEATNLLYFGDSALSWTSGEDRFDGMQLSNNYLLTCNGDPMFHSVKGIFGVRLANVKDAFLSEVRVENLRELSPIGSDVCGSYQKSHDIQQQLPYLYGFTGNNIHGVSVIDSNVLFSNLKVNNLNSLTGNSTGMTVYPRASVRFDGANNEFSQIIGGSQFLANNLDYDDLEPLLASPNQMPRGCAVKSENFEHYESRIVIESMSKEDGTYVNVECVTGYVGCDDEKFDGWTDFGDSSNKCDSTDDVIDEIKDSVVYLSERQTRVPLLKHESSHTELMSMLSKVNIDDIDSENIIINDNGNVVSSNSRNSNAHNHNNMVYVMIGIISTAVVFALCSFTHSFYAQSKIKEMNNEWNGYQKI